MVSINDKPLDNAWGHSVINYWIMHGVIQEQMIGYAWGHSVDKRGHSIINY